MTRLRIWLTAAWMMELIAELESELELEPRDGGGVMEDGSLLVVFKPIDVLLELESVLGSISPLLVLLEPELNGSESVLFELESVLGSMLVLLEPNVNGSESVLLELESEGSKLVLLKLGSIEVLFEVESVLLSS